MFLRKIFRGVWMKSSSRIMTFFADKSGCIRFLTSYQFGKKWWLILVCQNHKKRTVIKTYKDFDKCPEGG
jgi:hypothetical protein